MARQTVVRNMADGIITIEDGSSPANAVQLVVDEGDMSFAVAQRESVAVMDRTDLSSLRAGKAKPCGGRFRVKLKEFLSSGSDYPVTPHEALFGVGAASSWLSTNTDGGGVRTVRIRFTCVSPITGEQAEEIVFEMCYELNETFSEKADADLLAVSFRDFEERPTVAKRTSANPTDEPTLELTTAE
ncbi:MAG: hypothetical protein ACLQVA_02675 [Candidatus Brocadiia bacterium]